jgi:segregation and condensation protein B
MEDDMTDQNRDVLSEQDEDQITLEAVEDDQIAAPAVADDTVEPIAETAEPVSMDQEVMQEESEPVAEDETPANQVEAPAQEREFPDGLDAPLTQGERDIDRVIGVLLGEPPGVEQEVPEDEAAAEVREEPLEAQTQEAGEQPEQVPTIESVLEAILFATDEPLTDGKLAGIVETTAKQVRQSIENLNAAYAAQNHAFRIEQIAGGYQMLTLNTYNPWLKKMLRVRSDNKLSPAAMETLAIIAYKQPIIRADIEAIRGVAVGEVIRSLMYKGLVKITGRAEILGRPMLYGTTKKFLEVFGLNSLKDLPKAEELKNPDRG